MACVPLAIVAGRGSLNGLPKTITQSFRLLSHKKFSPATSSDLSNVHLLNSGGNRWILLFRTLNVHIVVEIFKIPLASSSTN